MNDRLQMPSAMPADLAEVLSDRAGDALEHTPQDLADAREELIEEAMGKGKLWATLQGWLDLSDGREFDKRLQQLAAHLHDLMHGADVERARNESWTEYSEAKYRSARVEAREFVQSLVTVTEDEITDRADRIAAQRLEDA